MEAVPAPARSRPQPGAAVGIYAPREAARWTAHGKQRVNEQKLMAPTTLTTLEHHFDDFGPEADGAYDFGLPL
eukprot:gene8961-biopygen8861